MTQNCQRSVVQLDLDPPRPYNAGVCGSCLSASPDQGDDERISDTDATNERGRANVNTQSNSTQDNTQENNACNKATRNSAMRNNATRNNNRMNTGLPAMSRNVTQIKDDDSDVATLTCNRLRKAIGDKGTFCSLVDSQCPLHCVGSSDCDVGDCNACSQ